MGVDISGVQGAVDFSLEGLKIALHDIVKVDQSKVKVIDYFSRGWSLGEEDGRTSAKSLGIYLVLGD